MLTQEVESLTARAACCGMLLAAEPNCRIDLPFRGRRLKARITGTGALKLVSPGRMVVIKNYVAAAQLGPVRIVDSDGSQVDLEALLWSNEAQFEIG